jgi:hypothetical protein
VAIPSPQGSRLDSLVRSSSDHAPTGRISCAWTERRAKGVAGDIVAENVTCAVESNSSTTVTCPLSSVRPIHNRATLKRRNFMRFFACARDLSFESPDGPLPDAVATGAEPFLVVGAIAGG